MEPEIDLDKINFGGGRQPDPKPKSPTAKRESARSVGRPSKNAKQSELQNEIESVIKLALLPIVMRDVHVIVEEGKTPEFFSCGNVYVEASPKEGYVLTVEGKQLAAAMAAIVIDSPFLMKIFTMGDEFGKWVALLMALQPFAMTVYHNHITVKRTEHVDSES